MRKSIVIGMSALLLLGSCDTYTGMGAYTGSTLGSVFGSAIGGISGGPRGSDVGTIVGMVGGAVAGAAIGQAADRRQAEQRAADWEQYEQDRGDRAAARARRHGKSGSYGQRDYGYNSESDAYDSGFDPNNGGDDRIYDFNGSDYTGNYTTQHPEVTMPMQSGVENLAGDLKYTPNIEVRNARFIDANQDGKIGRGEMCKVIFEVYNCGNQTLYDVVPTVIEVNGNRHIRISPNMHVEQLQPGRGIRYTALVKAGNRLGNGYARLCVSVVHGGKAISKVSEFNIPTVK